MSVQIIFAIRKDPHDELSLMGLPVSEWESGVLLFTQADRADAFMRTYPDMPAGSVRAIVEVDGLAGLLHQLKDKKAFTHVITDMQHGPGYERLNEKQTIKIEDYITHLVKQPV